MGNENTRKTILVDLDGDGDLDAFEANLLDYPNEVWWNNGDGIFVNSGQTLGGSWSFDAGLSDLDGDGDLDAFVANGNNQANKVWLNIGAGIFTDSGQVLGNSNSWTVALGDLDGDGDIDAFVGNNAQPDKVWFNQTIVNNLDFADLDVPWMSQLDPQWQEIGGKDVEYDFASNWVGTGQSTGIDRWGCALTSAAMVLRYHGVDQGVVFDKKHRIKGYIPTNPATLNSWLINFNGYTQWGGVIWSAITKYAKDASEYAYSGSGETFEFYYPSYSDQQVKDDIDDEVPGILKLVKNNKTHFVITRGYDGTDVLINDPNQMVDGTPPHSLDELYPTSTHTRSRLARFVPSDTDLSYLWVFGEPGLKLEVDGSGFDIDNDFGFVESLDDDIDTDDSSSPAQYTYGLPKPEGNKTYLVNVSNGGNEVIKIVDVRLYDQNGNQYVWPVALWFRDGETKKVVMLELSESLDAVNDLTEMDWGKLIDDIRELSALDMIRPPGWQQSLLNQLNTAQKLTEEGNIHSAKLLLNNMIKLIENHNYDFAYKVDDLLIYEMKLLIQTLDNL